LHFFVAGGILFGIYRLSHPPGTDLLARDKTIVVDKQVLLNFLQYRSKAFETEYFSQELDALPPEEREKLAEQYIEEEMLYREAKSLGLEQGDYVIRQRLVQKMRYLIDDLTEGGSALRSPSHMCSWMHQHVTTMRRKRWPISSRLN
jgi:hypothetical protein